MKKTLLVGSLMFLLAVPTTPALACTYEDVSIDSDGTVHGRYVPCQNPDCPDFQRHFNMKENIVYCHDIADERSPEEQTKEAQEKQAAKNEQPQTEKEPQTEDQPQPKLDSETNKNPSQSVKAALAEQDVMNRISSPIEAEKDEQA